MSYTIINQTWNTTQQAQTLRQAQLYLAAHEDDAVLVQLDGRTIEVSGAVKYERERLANRITRADLSEFLVGGREAPITLAMVGRRAPIRVGLLPANAKYRETLATARSRRHWPITALEIWHCPKWLLQMLPIYHSSAARTVFYGQA